MTSNDGLRAAFKEAAAIAAEAPEELREIAYQRALDALLSARAPIAPPASGGETHSPASTHAHSSARQAPRLDEQRKKPAQSGDVTRLLEVLDRTELAPLLRGRKVLDRALLVLRAAAARDVDALTAADIATVLTVKFREATTAPAVRMALDRNTQYTDRRPSGSQFQYSLMAPGQEYLDALPKMSSGNTPSARRPKPRGRPPKKADPSAKATPAREAPQRKAAPAAKRSGRPGPMAAMLSLIAEGYFATPRTMSAFLKHLQERRALVYKPTDMTAPLQRLVRTDALTREKNAEGQYEYSTAKPTP